jgi:hypothetical protein
MPRAEALGVFSWASALPGYPLLPSDAATGKDVDFVHPRSMS